MSETFTFKDAQELAVVTRSGFVESRHAGAAVALSADGDELISLGDTAAKVLTRSALKPLQSLAMHTAGLELGDDEERAMSLASHGGSPEHLQIVTRMLEAGGLTADDLQCPAAWPMEHSAKVQYIAEGLDPTPIAHCCSGKHAAMLRTCGVNGWETSEYLDQTHPLQQAIRETVQRFAGEIPDVVAVDGCGTPTFGLTLLGLAKAYRRMATAEKSSPFPLHRRAALLLQAARSNAWVVQAAGTGDSALIDELGVFAKFGAEGISVVAAPNGSVAVVKILDGSLRAARLVAVELLTRTGAISVEDLDGVRSKLQLSVTGGGATVGSVEVSF